VHSQLHYTKTSTLIQNSMYAVSTRSDGCTAKLWSICNRPSNDAHT